MADYPDDEWDDYPEYAETNDCDHEDYDLDILTGRASCNHCDHRWYMSEQEFKRHQELVAAPYPGEDSDDQPPSPG